MTERRSSQRRPFTGEVEILEQFRGHSGTAIARDISATGMFLITMAPYRLGESVSVRFLLPSSSCHIEVAGCVIRLQPPEEGLNPSMVGVVLRFDDADNWALSEVGRYVGKAPRVAAVVMTSDEPSRPQ